jgi:hypothetical protein
VHSSYIQIALSSEGSPGFASGIHFVYPYECDVGTVPRFNRAILHTSRSLTRSLPCRYAAASSCASDAALARARSCGY